jgi:hypothetical protein
LELGFSRLVENIPAIGSPGYDKVMRGVTDKIIHSDTLVTYLTVTNIGNNVVRVTVVHYIAQYSAGFGGSNDLHGHTLALLGETVGDQLPMLVKFMDDPAEDLPHALAMEAVVVPSEAQVTAYFANPAAENLLPGAPVAQGGVAMNLTNMCPSPWLGPLILWTSRLHTRRCRWARP